MDQATYDRGLAKRRKVLGEDYVNRALANADDFNRDFQRIVAALRAAGAYAKLA